MLIDPGLVIARVPLRLSLGGGGTDVPLYADRFGGTVLTGTISLSVTVIARLGSVDGSTRFHHDMSETAAHVLDVRNPYLRVALQLLEISDPCEVASLGPVPAGTGLGSSGAFTVGLLAALHALQGNAPSAAELAEQAFLLESEHLGRIVGRQDPYACALGGMRRLDIDPGGNVRSSRLSIPPAGMADLQAGLHLYYSGQRRDSSCELHVEPAAEAARIAGLHEVRRIGLESQKALEAGDRRGLAALMREHWAVKDSTASETRWGELVQAAVDAGASAAKVVGAGGGGFVLMCAEPNKVEGVGRALKSSGLVHVPFRFVEHGLDVTTLPPIT